MAHKLTTPAAVAAMLVAMLAPAHAADYVQAPGSSLAFATRYDGEMFTGQFGGFDTRLSFDPGRLDDARLEVTIELAGTRTGNSDRDSTLAGADFFDVAKFAKARYVADRFRALGGDRYAADGTPAGDAFLVNTAVANNQGGAAVTALPKFEIDVVATMRRSSGW